MGSDEKNSVSGLEILLRHIFVTIIRALDEAAAGEKREGAGIPVKAVTRP